jgi:hypothetical protein
VADSHDLSKHDSGVTIKEGNAAKTLAVLERVHHQGLGGLEHNLCHFVCLQRVRVLHLLATSFLAHLPVDLDDTASRATAAHETDGRISGLDLSWDIQRLDLGGEVLHGLEGGIRLEDHDITSAGQVVLVETLDVHANVVTGTGLVHALVVHFHSEDLTGARIGSGVGGHEDNFIAGLDNTLLDASSEHITHTLDLVGTRDGEAKRSIGFALGNDNHVVEGIKEAVDVDLVTLNVDDVHAVPPRHVGRLGDQVVAHPAGDRNDGHRLLDKVGLPANTLKHVLHLIADFHVPSLLVAGNIGIHLVDTNDELLHTQQVNETGMLAGLSLDLSSLVVTLLDGGGEVTVGRNHEQAHISLSGTGNHVLDEITMTRGIDDGVMPFVGEEFLGGASDGHTTLTLLLLAIHIESEGERRLAQSIGFFLELLNFTLGNATKLENQTSSGGGLAGIDMSANDCKRSNRIRMIRQRLSLRCSKIRKQCGLLQRSPLVPRGGGARRWGNMHVDEQGSYS